jgi:hypothetical protein
MDMTRRSERDGDMHQERRHTERQPVGFYIQLFVDEEPHRYFATDLSAQGLYMERPLAPMQRGSDKMRLEIHLPNAEEAIWATGEVVHDRIDSLFHGSGVRFTTMTTSHALWLRDWLRQSSRTDKFITHPARRQSKIPLARAQAAKFA